MPTSNTSPTLNAYFEAERLRRSHLEIKIAILESISSNPNATYSQINRCTMLAWAVVKREVNLLEKQRLIAQDAQSKKSRFKLTELGASVLERYTRLQRLFALKEEASDLLPSKTLKGSDSLNMIQVLAQ